MTTLRVSLKCLAALCAIVLLARCTSTVDSTPPGGGGRSFSFPTTGVAVDGQAMLLAIDDQLLPLRENVSYYLSKPAIRKEPVLAPSKADDKAPDQLATHFYGTVLQDQGKFRMWYYACYLDDPAKRTAADPTYLHQGPVCYAESPDGIQWTKPNLGQAVIKGSKDNNAILLPDDRIETVNLIKEESDPDPQRRYKMVYNTHNGKTWVIRTATSPDGLHWTAAKDFGIDKFIETSSFYKFNGLYVVNGQRSLHSEGGNPEGRQGRAIVSTNFDKWLPGHTDAFLINEPTNSADRGGRKPYDQVHLGVGAASFGNVLVGLYGLWHNEPGDETRKIPNAWFGFAKTSADLGLLVSNDGLHFREPVKGHPYISRVDSPATPFQGKEYPTILCQSGNGILNVGDETRIYHGRWRNTEYGMEYWGEVGLATLPRDRWGAVGLYPEDSRFYEARGSVWSAPVTLPGGGCQLVLNADGAAGMKVEVSDPQFNLLPEYSGERAGKSDKSSGLDCPVAFSAGNLAGLGGKTVRFRVELAKQGADNPRLYAVYLRSPAK
jgi:hypothetical protein